MGINVKIDGVRRSSTAHRVQDRFFIHEFEQNSKKIYVGALADGCTNDPDDLDYHPEIGAKWIVKEFAKQAEIFYHQGARGIALGRKIALAILSGMRDYQPQYPRSKWITGDHGKYCDELVATLYGFVLDDKDLALVTSGDGFVLLNGKCQYIPDDGRYPCDMLIMEPEAQWEKKLDSYFFHFSSLDVSQIETFGIASDGLGEVSGVNISAITNVEKTLKDFGHDPESLVRKLVRLPDISKDLDDITVIALSIERN